MKGFELFCAVNGVAISRLSAADVLAMKKYCLALNLMVMKTPMTGKTFMKMFPHRSVKCPTAKRA